MTQTSNLSDLQQRLRSKMDADRQTIENLTKEHLQTLSDSLQQQSSAAAGSIGENIETQKKSLINLIGSTETQVTDAFNSSKDLLTEQAKETYKITIKALADLQQKAGNVADTTSEATDKAARNLRRSLALWPLITILICSVICAAAFGVTLLLGQQITTQTGELLQVRQSLNQARSQLQTFGIEVSESDQGRFLILPPRLTATTGYTVGQNEAVKLSRK